MSSSSINAQTFDITILSVQNAPSSFSITDPILVSSYYENDPDTLVAQGTVSLDPFEPGTIDLATVSV